MPGEGADTPGKLSRMSIVRCVAPCWERTSPWARAPCAGLFGMGQAVGDGGRQFGSVVHDASGVRGEQSLDHVAKVVRVGAEEHGRPESGRLDHVLPAAIREAAADKHHVGQAPTGGSARPTYPAAARPASRGEEPCSRRSCDDRAGGREIRSAGPRPRNAPCAGERGSVAGPENASGRRGTRRLRPPPRFPACCRRRRRARIRRCRRRPAARAFSDCGDRSRRDRT